MSLPLEPPLRCPGRCKGGTCRVAPPSGCTSSVAPRCLYQKRRDWEWTRRKIEDFTGTKMWYIYIVVYDEKIWLYYWDPLVSWNMASENPWLLDSRRFFLIDSTYPFRSRTGQGSYCHGLIAGGNLMDCLETKNLKSFSSVDGRDSWLPITAFVDVNSIFCSKTALSPFKAQNTVNSNTTMFGYVKRTLITG